MQHSPDTSISYPQIRSVPLKTPWTRSRKVTTLGTMGDRPAIRNSSLELKLRQVFFLSDRWWLILDRLWSHMLITKYIFLLDPFANNVMMNFEWCNDTWESRYVWYSRINYSLFFVILICIQTQYTIIKHPQRSVVSNFWKFIKSIKCQFVSLFFWVTQFVSLARAKATKNQSPHIIHHLKRTIKVPSMLAIWKRLHVYNNIHLKVKTIYLP